LVSGSLDRKARLWNAASGERLQTFPHSLDLGNIALSADGKVVCTTTTDGRMATMNSVVRVWSGSTGKMIRSLTFDRSSSPGVQLSPEGDYCAAVALPYSTLWEVATGNSGPTGYGDDILLPPAGRSALLIDTYWRHVDGLDKLDGGTRKKIMDAVPRGTAFSADGRTIALGLDDGSIRLIEAPSFKEIRSLTGHRGTVNHVLFSADGRWLASGSADGTILIWDLRP
jgi:WD40 repeat protein